MVIDITKRPGKDFFIRPGLRIHLEGNIRAECASVSPFPVIYHIIIIMWFLFARKNEPHPFELPNMLHTAFQDRKSTRLNSSHITRSRMPSSA